MKAQHHQDYLCQRCICDRRVLENTLESRDQIERVLRRQATFEVIPPRKSLFSYSKEITKPAVFAQRITLFGLARSETDRTIMRKTYERTDENEYGFGWHLGSD